MRSFFNNTNLTEVGFRLKGTNRIFTIPEMEQRINSQRLSADTVIADYEPVDLSLAEINGVLAYAQQHTATKQEILLRSGGEKFSSQEAFLRNCANASDAELTAVEVVVCRGNTVEMTLPIGKLFDLRSNNAAAAKAARKSSVKDFLMLSGHTEVDAECMAEDFVNGRAVNASASSGFVAPAIVENGATFDTCTDENGKKFDVALFCGDTPVTDSEANLAVKKFGVAANGICFKRFSKRGNRIVAGAALPGKLGEWTPKGKK